MELELVNTEADTAFVQSLGDLSGSFLLKILNSSPDCIKIIDTAGRLTFMNFNGQCAMEIDDFEGVRGMQWCSLWPEDLQQKIDLAVADAVTGKSSRFEAFCPTAKGTARWWEVTVTPVTNSAGKIEQVLSVSRDVTEQIDREERLRRRSKRSQKIASKLSRELATKKAELVQHDTMLREIDHRVKNSLTMIISILRLQMRTLTNSDALAAIQDAANRVVAVSKIHEQLYASTSLEEIDIKAYVERLANDLHSAMAEIETSLVLDLEPILMTTDKAIAVGMIVSELLGNAYRHGVANRPNSSITIRFARSNDDKFLLEVKDDGNGYSRQLEDDSSVFSETDSTGLGSKIIVIYAKQLGAHLTVTTAPNAGTLTKLIF